jgi:hypothetical protein
MTLDQLAIEAKTDKASNGHNYTKVYETYLERHRYEPLVIWELGIGGYQHPDRGGESLKLWNDYFPNAKIVGVDYYQKDGLGNFRTVIAQGSQDDEEFLKGLVRHWGLPDLIIDDASHVCPLTIKSFEILFPILKPGGLYFCEDVHTSFWMEYKGHPDPAEHGTVGTTLNFFQKLTAQLSQDTLQPEFRNSYAGYLDFIHFYRNLVIIKKL